MKVYLKNSQRSVRINQQRTTGLLKKALSLLGIPRAELSILFVNDRRMQELNREYRGLDKTTDVLSFPQLDAEEMKKISSGVPSPRPRTSELPALDYALPLGDIVINLHKAKRQAAEHGLPFNEELKRLLVHGLIHLLGYDHEKNRYQKNKMEAKERELLESLK